MLKRQVNFWKFVDSSIQWNFFYLYNFSFFFNYSVVATIHINKINWIFSLEISHFQEFPKTTATTITTMAKQIYQKRKKYQKKEKEKISQWMNRIRPIQKKSPIFSRWISQKITVICFKFLDARVLENKMQLNENLLDLSFCVSRLVFSAFSFTILFVKMLIYLSFD